jgi:hypothetical protein
MDSFTFFTLLRNITPTTGLFSWKWNLIYEDERRNGKEE